ncbi:peroxiredoxin, Ohr subfamily [Pseudooceanicola antarcticus]|uniref:Organic hydroperoxide resistance protein n=1 Tax=Pseudooceanicola antarcticus TaxID=1247613 RepID=A0A285J391_9RHOB|nr:organic hydroperoxide resistance protein [Pseudooceanicola antarcticus]PJE29701.1 organic hydroperoxide resistance protein [Pseudooceanicola antarcticus]SNY54779.1 peroxiredoxin, Ohr subfamily [Pseudooceanicola antarcticus]
MSITPLYTTKATAEGGREGRAATADGALEVALVTPKELGGAGGAGTNPEQLFAAGYAACFLSALKAVARMQKKTVPEDAKANAEVGIGKREDGGFGLTVALSIELPGLPDDEADALIAAAHEVCPYSHATRGNIDVSLSRA